MCGGGRGGGWAAGGGQRGSNSNPASASTVVVGARVSVNVLECYIQKCILSSHTEKCALQTAPCHASRRASAKQPLPSSRTSTESRHHPITTILSSTLIQARVGAPEHRSLTLDSCVTKLCWHSPERRGEFHAHGSTRQRHGPLGSPPSATGRLTQRPVTPPGGINLEQQQFPSSVSSTVSRIIRTQMKS